MYDLKFNEDFLYIDEKKLIKSIHMPKLWHKNPNLILLPEERLYGKKDTINNYLLKNNIKNDMDNVINNNNFENSEVFDSLLADYQNWMTQTLIENINSPGNTFETLKNDELISYTKKEKKEKEFVTEKVINDNQPIYTSTLESDVPIRTVKKTEKKPRKAVDLDLKIKDLEAGKIINISGINEYGIGTRTVNYTNPKNMFVTRDERIMTNKYDAFKTFLSLLKKDKYKKKYEKELIKAQKFFNVKDSKKSKRYEESEEESGKKEKSKKYDSEEESEEISKKSGKNKKEKSKKYKESEESEKYDSEEESKSEDESKSEKKKSKKSKKYESEEESEKKKSKKYDSEEESGKKKIKKSKKSGKEKSRDDIEDDILDDTVDIFDFNTYKDEYKLMGKYYEGLERYLRTALLIDYKYNHLNEKNRHIFDDVLENKPKKERKQYIELMLDVFEPLYMLHQFYRHFAPKKMNKLNEIYNKYQTVPAEMFNRMYRVYVDKNWVDQALWFE